MELTRNSVVHIRRKLFLCGSTHRMQDSMKCCERQTGMYILKQQLLQPTQEKLYLRTKKKKLGIRNEGKKYTVKSSEFNSNSKSHNGSVFQTQIPQFSMQEFLENYYIIH